MSSDAAALPDGDSPIRLGAVSYLNTLPLIEGLGKLRDVSLTLTAPARLIDLLLEGRIDVGLVSLIDAQRSAQPLALIPVGMIASDGATLTVRLFSRVPPGEIKKLSVDADSHTSVALARLILIERFGVRPEIEEVDADALRARIESGASGGAAAAGTAGGWPEALLVIGDKVVTDSPPAVLYPHQMDLGQAWKEMTGLPFVYAMWMCRAAEADSERVRLAAAMLDRQRRHNALRLDWIVDARAAARRWPEDLAREYVGRRLEYEPREQHREAVRRFFELCADRGLVERRRQVEWVGERHEGTEARRHEG